MTFAEFQDFCEAKAGVEATFPFGDATLVYKVGGKMFALTSIDDSPVGDRMSPPFEFINLKCDPDYAIELRADYEYISPAWHMSKKHWNSVFTDQDIPEKLIYELIDHSYDLVFKNLTKKLQNEILNG